MSFFHVLKREALMKEDRFIIKFNLTIPDKKQLSIKQRYDILKP